MKKAIFKFGLFLLAVLLPIGCSSDDEEEIKGTLIEEVDCGNDVSTFFMEHIPHIGGKLTYLYDKQADATKDFIIINNQEDFTNTFIEEVILPKIDFSKYSLVIGYTSFQQPSKKGDKIPRELKKQSLFRTDNGYTIELQYSYDTVGNDYIITPIMQYINFWGIYPKLDETQLVSINLKYK